MKRSVLFPNLIVIGNSFEKLTLFVNRMMRPIRSERIREFRPSFVLKFGYVPTVHTKYRPWMVHTGQFEIRNVTAPTESEGGRNSPLQINRQQF